jgi:lipid-binding SYLF domain-containing protein
MGAHRSTGPRGASSSKTEKSMTRIPRYLSAALAAIATAVLFAAPASAQGEQQKLVTAAEVTLQNFLRDPEMTWLQRNFGRARGVLIAPEIVKAGFIFGGSGGRAVLFAKEGGQWRGPAFYTMATASVGFQAGVSVSEMITLVMTEKGMNSMLAANFKLGGDASVAAGPVGVGAKSDVVADMIAFTRAKGIYGGLNLDGTLVNLSDDWNRAFYGAPVQPTDIFVRGSVTNPGADNLRAAIAKAAGGAK